MCAEHLRRWSAKKSRRESNCSSSSSKAVAVAAVEGGRPRPLYRRCPHRAGVLLLLLVLLQARLRFRTREERERSEVERSF
jgi:hypothetical protein|eukprot:COSAG06_NODE_1536_length_9152_cov_19.634044_9_plen_81_part_00